MLDPKSKFKIIISIEIFFVSLSIFAIFYEIVRVYLFNNEMNGGLVSLSLLVLVIAGGHMFLKIYVMIPSLVKICYKGNLLFRLPSQYSLLPTKEHLPHQRKSRFVQILIHRDNTKTNKPICIFHAEYYDFAISKLVDYQCTDEAMQTGFCMYHDDYYINGKEIELGNALNEKINKLIDDGQEVFCIGYNIPFVSLTEKIIRKPIYFHGANIRIADFRGSVFANNAIAYFVRTSFEETSFEGTVFKDKVLFNHSQFKRISKRPGFFHQWEKDYNLEVKFSGFANFSNSKFYKSANFNSTEFNGVAMFDNTDFFNETVFSNSRFCVDARKSPLDKASFHSSLSTDHMFEGHNVIPTGG